MKNRRLNMTDGDILDDLVSANSSMGWTQDADDSFSVLRNTGNASPYAAPVSALDANMDPLEQLQHEAEAVLRNPESASSFRQSTLAERPPAMPEGDAQSQHQSAGTDAETGSLLDLLAGPAGINDLIGTMDSLDTHRLLLPPTTPDVLQLFAGDIVMHQRHGMTAALTRREHHLVSMDSAYLPAAQIEGEQP
jgi:hypothetical protein